MDKHLWRVARSNKVEGGAMKVSPYFVDVKQIAISLLDKGCGGCAPDRITKLEGWRLRNAVGRAVSAALDEIRDERRIKQPRWFSDQNYNLCVREIIAAMPKVQ